MGRSARVLLGILFLFAAIVTKAQAPNMANAGAVASSGAGARPSVAKAPVAAKALNLPMFFEANKGQTDSRVQFMARGTGYTLLLTPTETILAAAKTQVSRASNGFSSPPSPVSISNSSPGSLIQMQLVGANSEPAMRGVEELPGKVNYLLGNDPAKWHTGVPLYSQVRTQQVYPGVDLLFHGDQKELEYDFVVAPGADPSKIAFRIRGAARVEIDAQGDLVLHAADSEFLMHKPIIYQTIASERRAIEGSFVKRGRNEVAFRLGAYDHSQNLVIDPAIGYASFLGGNGDELSGGFAVDDSTPGSPKLYLGGFTSDSTTFPETNIVIGSGTSMTAPAVAEVGFVAKIDPTASKSASLIYLTFVGGKTPTINTNPGCESAFVWLALDKSQGAANIEPVLGGVTNCSDFPNAIVLNPVSGTGNGFASVVARLNISGTAIDKAAVLGGSNDVQGGFVAVGTAGNVILSGETKATNLPAKNAYVSAFNDGNLTAFDDCYVTILNRTDLSIGYLTYLNIGAGSTNMNGVGCGAFEDSSGNILAGGNTFSITAFNLGPGGTSLANGFQTTFQGTENTFAMKLNPSLAGVNQLLYATYFGGGGTTRAANGSFDLGNGVVAIVGGTTSNSAVGDIPLKNAFLSQNNAVGGGLIGYLLVLDTSQTGAASLLCSTYFGGTGGGDIVDAVSYDAGDPTNFRIILGGRTSSTDFPTLNPIQPYVGALVGAMQSPDGFVAVLKVPLPTQTPFNAALVFSTYIGGSNPPAAITVTQPPTLFEDDRITAVAVDANHTIYAVGDTNSPQGFFANTNPTTTINGFQTTCSSCGAQIALDDVAVFSIGTGGSATLQSIAVTPTTATIAAGQTQQFHAVGNFNDGTEQDITNTVTWTTVPTGIATMSTTTPGLAMGVAAGATAVTPALGTATVLNTGTLTVTPPTLVSITVFPNPELVNVGGTNQLAATGNFSDGTQQDFTNTATWSSSDTTIATVSATGLATGVKVGGPVTIQAAQAGLVGSTSVTVTSTFTGPNQLGQLFVSLGNGLVGVFKSDGTFLGAINTGQVLDAGLEFDATGNLYVTTFNTPIGVVKFDTNGKLLGPFGTGYTGNPESIVFTHAGNAIVGEAQNPDPTNPAPVPVLELDASGNPIATFNVARQDRGSDWVELLQDQKTLLYTSEGTSVKSFDISKNQQNADFATNLPGLSAFALRQLPDGTVLVADSTAALRLTSGGAIETTYTPNPASQGIFALNLDPDGTSFWTADLITGVIYRFDIASGNQLTSFTAPSHFVSGLAIFGEKAPGQNNITVTENGSGNGTVTSQPAGINCPTVCVAPFTDNSAVVLTASPAQGSSFGGFSPNCTASSPQTNPPSCTVSLATTDVAVSVTFNGSTGPTLKSIAVTPVNPTEPINLSLQFTATGTFSDGSTKDITSTVAWASSNTQAATISASGLATTGATTALTTTISAMLDNVTGSTVLTVSNSPISISVTPPPGGAFPPVPPGGRLAIGIVLTSIPGFSGTVTFSCTTSSPTITCAPDPASVTLTPGGPTDVAIVLNTFCTGTTTAQVGPAPGGFGGGIALLLLSLTLGGFVWTYRQSPRWALSFAVLVLMAIGGAACSSLPKGPNGATPPGNYSVTFSATVNGVTTTTPPIPFTVQ
jgi:Bacterial Ig-like domain (group 2)